MATDLSIRIQRLLYGAFVALGVYYLAFQGDAGLAAATWGIALVFDPFDQSVSWQHRPRWQRLWLLVHVAAVVALFVASLLL
ncbi:MAG: hypothetical protein MUC47_00545 [Candidatus Kapabacteria bacterium]|nr:hypothetical protein [Candidatus Kapabacteria bacterium]